MTSTVAGLARRFAGFADPDHPVDGALLLAPATIAAAAEVLDAASEQRIPVGFRGGGTHLGLGHPVEPHVVLSSRRMDRLVAWHPEDLVAVVEAGMRVADLEAMLAGRGQSAILPETPGEATVGGVVAAGVSGWRRLRYGPTRDRVLEVVLATGDGRVVRAGGRVVKNVTGYDLPRLATGSLGALGMIGSVALKLWPIGAVAATITVADAVGAHLTAFRPLAVIGSDDGDRVYLAGTAEEVAAQAAELGGSVADGLHWPEPLRTTWQVAIRVPPRLIMDAVSRVPAGWRYRAAHGVGEVIAGGEQAEIPELEEGRRWAESVGGAVVRTAAPAGAGFDPWGTPPPSLGLQRRVKEAFDPLGICNPGILPGGL